MSHINVSNLTFRYDGNPNPVFENVSFQLDTDWKLGFTGRNGRGKTTFLKLLMGEFEHEGTISASVPFSYFPFPVPEPHRDTICILEEAAPEAQTWELCRELGLLDVDQDVLYRPYETLSYGERTKSLIAALFLRKNHFLLLDEPTNHLDRAGHEVMARYLAAKRGFILVSHDRLLLDEVIDHVLSINRTNIEVRRGDFSSWIADKTRQDEQEEAENRLLKRDIARLREASKRTSNWSDKVEAAKFGMNANARASGLRPDRGALGHKAAKMMKRAKSIESRQQDAIAEKSKLLRNVEVQDTLKISPKRYHSDTIAELEDVSVSYNGRCAVAGVNLRLRREERLALRGKNGSGKSSILRLLLGEPVPHTGRLKVGSGLEISYIPQDSSFLSGDLAAFSQKAGIDRSLFMAILHKLGFVRSDFETELHCLSEGQKKKVLLARSLSESAHLYVWDEPLNYIDVQSRMQIEDLLLRGDPTMIFVEHDETFVRKIATDELVLPG